MTKIVNRPKVSIGLPTYNGSKKIMKAVVSVINQGYSNIEIIISDNCSTDNTQELCEALAQRYPAIRYYRQSVNKGVTSNYSFVLEQATGDYFMWLADDDSLDQGILKKYVDFMTANSDYALVSGRIRYWEGSKVAMIEKDFNMEQSYAHMRVINYYFRVMYGAMIYGLMNRRVAQSIPLRNRIGDDWHFVASVAFIGKIKTLDTIGYNKKFGGVSINMKNYAKVIGASWFSANFPHATIAFDAMSEIMFQSPHYAKMNVVSRFMLGVASCASVLLSHYVKVYPFIVGGRIKRWITRPFSEVPVSAS